MYPNTKRNLRSKYPQKDGWEIHEQDHWDNYIPDFVVERRNRGKIERVVVEVKLTEKVQGKDVRQLNQYVRNLAGGNTKIKDKVIVVPAGTDTRGF